MTHALAQYTFTFMQTVMCTIVVDVTGALPLTLCYAALKPRIIAAKPYSFCVAAYAEASVYT